MENTADWRTECKRHVQTVCKRHIETVLTPMQM